MKQRTTKHIAALLAVILMLTVIPVQAVSAAPAKLSMKDFEYISQGGSVMYFTDSDDMDGRITLLTDKNVKTHRGIKVGSKLSAVKKKYGEASRKKFDNKESFNKYIRQYDFRYGVDSETLKWKSYVEYTYEKNTENDRRLRFYLDKKDKVVTIVYIYLYKNYKLTDKNTKDIGFAFKAPAGKKITTKTVDGKKVKVLPAGTKIKYKQSKVPEFGILAKIFMYDTKNKECGHTSTPISFNWNWINGADMETLLTQSSFVKWDSSKKGYYAANLEKLGTYNYFEFVVYDVDFEGGYDLPVRYYFRLK